MEQNRSSSLEIKWRISRIEVDNISSSLILWQAVKESKLPLSLNFDFMASFCLLPIFSWLCHFWRFFFLFRDNKAIGLQQAPGVRFSKLPKPFRTQKSYTVCKSSGVLRNALLAMIIKTRYFSWDRVPLMHANNSRSLDIVIRCSLAESPPHDLWITAYE